MTNMKKLLLLATGSSAVCSYAQPPIEIPKSLIANIANNPSLDAHAALFLALFLLGILGIGGVLSKYLRLPVIASQIIAGIIMGPSLIDMGSWSVFDHTVNLFDYQSGVSYTVSSIDLIMYFVSMLSALLTVPFLLWIAGHETELDQLKQVGFVAVLAGLLGALLPLGIVGILVGYWATSWSQAISMGLIFAATSVSIPVAMLISFNKMNTRSARATLGAAVVDDIVAVILLSAFFVFSGQSGHHQSFLSSVGWMVGGGMLLIGAGLIIMPRIIGYAQRQGAAIIAVTAVAIMLAYCSAAELIAGLAGITGAYFAGLFHRQSDPDHKALAILSPFVQIILLPLFLGSIGLTCNLRVLDIGQWGVAFLVVAGALISKFLACFIATGLHNLTLKGAARWTGLESYLFGASMVARGEVGLVVATLVYTARIIPDSWYAIAIVAIVITTVLTPLFLSIGFDRQAGEGN